jgi:hypothetical protein
MRIWWEGIERPCRCKLEITPEGGALEVVGGAARRYVLATADDGELTDGVVDLGGPRVST